MTTDYSVHYQRLQPKFKDCTFNSDKKPEYLRTWLRLLAGIVRNTPNGKMQAHRELPQLGRAGLF